jgi:hypothetical protein
MPVYSLVVAAVLVAAIFSIWRGYAEFRERRQRMLRERIAYLLWVAADEAERAEAAAQSRGAI